MRFFFPTLLKNTKEVWKYVSLIMHNKISVGSDGEWVMSSFVPGDTGHGAVCVTDLARQ